eukprot:2726849-Amphidinium_carterae.1
MEPSIHMKIAWDILGRIACRRGCEVNEQALKQDQQTASSGVPLDQAELRPPEVHGTGRLAWAEAAV